MFTIPHLVFYIVLHGMHCCDTGLILPLTASDNLLSMENCVLSSDWHATVSTFFVRDQRDTVHRGLVRQSTPTLSLLEYDFLAVRLGVFQSASCGGGLLLGALLGLKILSVLCLRLFDCLDMSTRQYTVVLIVLSIVLIVLSI